MNENETGFNVYSNIEESDSDLSEYRKISLSDMASLSAAVGVFKQVAGGYLDAGGEGIYKVSFKNGVTGTMAKAKDGSGFIGAIFEGIVGSI